MSDNMSEWNDFDGGLENRGFDDWVSPWIVADDLEPVPEPVEDQPKRKWYRVQFSIYLTEEQASNVRLNFDHLTNAMSKDFQGKEPVSPTYYIDDQAMFEEPVVKYQWWKRTRIWNWIRPAKIYR